MNINIPSIWPAPDSTSTVPGTPVHYGPYVPSPVPSPWPAQGWICPICGAGLSPWTSVCPFCQPAPKVTCLPSVRYEGTITYSSLD